MDDSLTPRLTVHECQSSGGLQQAGAWKKHACINANCFNRLPLTYVLLVPQHQAVTPTSQSRETTASAPRECRCQRPAVAAPQLPCQRLVRRVLARVPRSNRSTLHRYTLQKFRAGTSSPRLVVAVFCCSTCTLYRRLLSRQPVMASDRPVRMKSCCMIHSLILQSLVLWPQTRADLSQGVACWMARAELRSISWFPLTRCGANMHDA